MKKPLRVRAAGILLLILAIIGILFCLSGILATWIIKPHLNTGLIEVLDASQDVLKNTEEGIKVVDSIIEDSMANLTIIITTFEDLKDTTQGISDSINASGALIGDDLRLTIVDTQNAISSAATSARFIDDALTFIARIPLIGVDYRPDEPLHISLNNIAAGLSNMPASLDTIEQSINTTASGLQLLNDGLAELTDNLSSYESDLQDARSIINSYETRIDQMQSKLTQFRMNLSKFLIGTSILVSGLFFWLGLAQVNILLQGIAYLQHDQRVVNLADLRRE